MPHSINDGNRSEAELRVRLDKAIIANEAEKALYEHMRGGLEKEVRRTQFVRKLMYLSMLFWLLSTWLSLLDSCGRKEVEVEVTPPLEDTGYTTDA